MINFDNLEYYYWESLYKFFRPLLFVEELEGVKDSFDVKYDFDDVIYSHLYRYEGVEIDSGQSFEGLDFTNATAFLEGTAGKNLEHCSKCQCFPEQAKYSCRTVVGERCIFPWIDSSTGLSFKGCRASNGGSWCPTQVNLTGHFMQSIHSWNFCGALCSISDGQRSHINDGNVGEYCNFFSK